MRRLISKLPLVCLSVLLFACPAAWAEAPPDAVDVVEPAPAAEAAAEEPAADADAEKPADEPDGKEDAEAKKSPAFLRVERDDDNRPLALETAIVTYIPADEKHKGVAVDLVGAVHVADGKYYEELNKAFESYDVLLYELVAPEGTRIPKGGHKKSESFIGSMQGGLKGLLDLEYQLEKVDYTKENFVHADMSPEEFAKSMKDRGESFWQILMRAMGQSAAMQASGKQPFSDVDLLVALFAKDRSLRLKKMFAAQFENMEASMGIFDGPEGSTIITLRNKKALEVLQREIDKGHKRIGIFYGAGHLADMEKHLAEDFGLKRDKERWLTAWDLRDKPAEPKEEEEKKEEVERVEEEAAAP